MVDVAFVCLGNICRSPMAEAIMRQRLKDRNINEIKVYSRGTGDWNLGEPPHKGTQKILNKHNIPFDGMISELFEATDDLITLLQWIKAMLITLNLSILILRANCSNC